MRRRFAEDSVAQVPVGQRPRHLDLGLLAVLVALDDARSVSAAALILGMSQPQVSVALGKLRQLFCDAMFVRTTNGMQPTPRASALVRSARGVLAQIDQGLFGEDRFDPATAQRPFVIAISDAGEAVVMPQVLSLLRRAAPNAAVKAVNLTIVDIANGLESGEIDLAVGYMPDLRKRNFFQQTLFTDGYVSLVRVQHPASGPRFDMAQFVQYEHAVVRAPIRPKDPIERHLVRKKIPYRIGFIGPHAVTLPIMVAQSDMIMTLASRLADYFLDLGAPLRKMELPFQLPKVEIRQYWHPRCQNDARSKWLRSLIAGAFHDTSMPEHFSKAHGGACTEVSEKRIS